VAVVARSVAARGDGSGHDGSCCPCGNVLCSSRIGWDALLCLRDVPKLEEEDFTAYFLQVVTLS